MGKIWGRTVPCQKLGRTCNNLVLTGCTASAPDTRDWAWGTSFPPVAASHVESDSDMLLFPAAYDDFGAVGMQPVAVNIWNDNVQFAVDRESLVVERGEVALLARHVELQYTALRAKR